MAETIDISPGLAQPFKDTRAEGYVTYYTKVGWDNWNLAAQQIAQLVKEKQITYEAAYKLYLQQMKDLEADKAKLQEKLDTIGKSKADVKARREELIARMVETRKLRDQAYAQAKEQKTNVTPSSGGRKYAAAAGSTGGKDPYDELMDEIVGSARKTVDDKIQVLSGGLNAGNVRDRFNTLQQAYTDGSIPADALTRDMTTYTLYKNAVDALVAQGNISVTDAEIAVATAISDKPAFISYIDSAKARIASKADDQIARGGGSSFTGAKQLDYDLMKIEGDVAGFGKDLTEYDALETAKKKELEAKQGLKITAPVLEPIDMITAARKEYLKKYGDIPRGVNLRIGNETLAEYKDLMPFEVTNAMADVSKIFGQYVDSEIQAMKAKALSEGRTLTAADITTATELGKQKARIAMFGDVYTPPEAEQVSAGETPTPPTVEEQKANIEAIKNMYRTGLPEGMDVGGLKAPSTTEPGVDIEEFFRNRVAPSGATEADLPPLRVGSPSEPFTPPSIGEKQEGMIGPTPTPEARRSIGDILLRGFRPELDRRTGELITPQMSGRERAEAIAGLDKRGLDQYQNFPESMRPPYPREVGGEVFRPLSASEFPAPNPRLNKLDRAALGIPETPMGDIMGSEVLGGDLGAKERAIQEGLRKRQELQDQLESLKSRREFFDEAGKAGSQPSPMDEALREEKKRKLQEQLESFKSRKEFFDEARKAGAEPSPMDKALMEEKKRKLQEQLDSLKSRKEFLDTAGEAGAPPKEGASIKTLEQKDQNARSQSFLAGTTKAQDDPKAAAKDLTKDSMGKYISSLYDSNSTKGAGAVPLSNLTQTVISEYAGDAVKQKKAIQLLTQLAYLDQTKSKINA
jgi:hypothetical protein